MKRTAAQHVTDLDTKIANLTRERERWNAIAVSESVLAHASSDDDVDRARGAVAAAKSMRKLAEQTRTVHDAGLRATVARLVELGLCYIEARLDDQYVEAVAGEAGP